MHALSNPLGDLLTSAGVFILIAASFRIWGLTGELKNSPLALRWHFLNAYIAFFVIGYSIFAGLFWNDYRHWYTLLIAIILFLGSIYVWIVSFLALQTVLNLRRVALLEQQNITDALTGLYNRRYLDQRIASEYESAQRYRHPLSVLMLDINRFKELNDTYGHQAGDLALRFLSELILASIREPDIAARYGGDEFVIIAPHTPLQAAAELAERVRRHIESHELKLAHAGKARQTLHLAVSIGVAELSPGIDSGETLIAGADEALYQAKQPGWGPVALHRSQPADPIAAPAAERMHGQVAVDIEAPRSRRG